MTARKTNRRESSGRYEPRLYPYQRRWVEDDSRFKIACKARQIGFSFVAAWRVVDKRLEKPGLTLWLSASERQALEGMEHVRRFCRELQVAAVHEENFVEGTLVKQQQVRFPNGSRIVALPANPDTVRGFAGDIVLDEFAFHRDAEAIWRAAFATATRGYQIEIISTPNGARGKYYELAHAAGLVDWESGRAPGIEQRSTDEPKHGARSTMRGVFSPHWVSLSLARAEGFVVDVEALRAAISDEDAWQQEYCCRFLTQAAHFIPPEMVVAAEHPTATTSLPSFVIRGSWPVLRESERRVGPLALSAAEGSGPTIEMRAVEAERRSRALRGTQPSLGEGTASAVPLQSLRAAPPWKGSGETQSACLSQAGFPQDFPTSPCYLGVDIGRRRDLTVLWLLEVESRGFGTHAPADTRRYVTRAVQTLERQPFAAQRRAIDALLALRVAFDSVGGHGGIYPEQSRGSRAEKVAPRGATTVLAGRGFSPDVHAAATAASSEGAGGNPAWVSPTGSPHLIRRCALDASGLGLMLAEELQARWGARVEPVVFTAAVKEELAVRVKRLLEERRLLLPYDPVIRASLAAVKRYVTPAGNIRFDADRTDASHADHFWALALALAAADDSGPTTEFLSTESPRAFAQAAAF
jgi:phage FluMu gp28-like protein